MAEKLAISEIIDLVADMDTDAKREMRPKTLGVQFTFLYLSFILLVFLSPETRIF